MEEEVTLIVEDVLAVVRGVYHSRHPMIVVKHGDDVAEQSGSVSDGVVIGVDELWTQSGKGFQRSIGSEIRELLGVAVIVFEMRPIGVYHNQLLGIIRS